MTWQEAVWEELEALEPLERFVACGAWITQMQQEVVPELAERRRLALVQAAEDYDNDYLKLAELIGTRKSAVERLVNEGRAVRRDHAT